MKQYLFIFRQSMVELTDAQMKRRGDEVRAWAFRLRDDGHTLSPHILGEERYVAPPHSNGTTQDGAGAVPVTAVLIADFASFDAARQAANAHPGRNYGVSVEVCEAAPPPGVSAAE